MLTQRTRKLELVSEVRRKLDTGEVTAARIRAQLTQAEVSRVMGVHPSTFARWESGRQTPTEGQALKLAGVIAMLERAAAS
jgi:DNA-binding transcriptional regulator YiaG